MKFQDKEWNTEEMKYLIVFILKLVSLISREAFCLLLGK